MWRIRRISVNPTFKLAVNATYTRFQKLQNFDSQRMVVKYVLKYVQYTAPLISKMNGSVNRRAPNGRGDQFETISNKSVFLLGTPVVLEKN